MYEPITYPYVRGEQKGIRKELLDKINIHDFHTGETVEIIQDFNCYQFDVKHFKLFDSLIEERKTSMGERICTAIQINIR